MVLLDSPHFIIFSQETTIEELIANLLKREENRAAHVFIDEIPFCDDFTPFSPQGIQYLTSIFTRYSVSQLSLKLDEYNQQFDHQNQVRE